MAELSSNLVADVVEKDTEEREDIADLVTFLMPSSDIVDSAVSFGMFYNKKVFNGWVKQPSACCGASSVAGAWNALHAYHRSNPQALQHTDVLHIYITIVQEKIDKKVAAFERKLGSKLSPVFWNTFGESVKEYGKEIGGKKGFSVTKSVAEKVIISMLTDYLKSKPVNEADGESGKVDDEAAFLNRNEFDCLLELYEMENAPITLSQTEGKEQKNSEAKQTDSDEEKDEVSDEEEDAAPSSKAAAAQQWVWRKEFMEILRLKSGLVKLCADRPSTAVIGNWGILDAIAYLSENFDLGTQVTAKTFMGKKKTAKSKLEVPLSKKDNEAHIQSQWDSLRSAFAHPNKVLLIHWTNHYALIFALREWYDERSKTYTRQVLTARKGQRPSAWADFHEIRDFLLNWDGYKIMVISNTAEPEKSSTKK